MTHKERIVRGSVVSEHILQLFDGADSLGESVAQFLHAGLVDGDACLVVARPANVKRILAVLERHGHEPEALTQSGALTIADAATTLRAFMWNGSPDRSRFCGVVGRLVRSLSEGAGGRLSVYGEMVDILAEEGNFRGAGALEALWNELGASVSFKLLCGYASAHFAAANGGTTLRAVCGHHGRVQRMEADLLGNWLLDQQEPDEVSPLSA